MPDIPPPPPSSSAGDLVQLDRDHPGFRDRSYRKRRNQIAALALGHRVGEPVPRVDYADVEHGVWKTALTKLAPLHGRYACDTFQRAWPLLGFREDRIPQFAEVNDILAARTGFTLAPVAGLVTPSVFMTQLATRHFLATQYIRHHSAPLYTPEPDVIHELVGHAALLADSEFARMNRRFGDATLTSDEPTILALIRVYWYALEFGVVRSGAGKKVVGAGLLSSFGELGQFESKPQLLPFDIEVIRKTPFDPTDYQSTLFVADSQEAMFAALDAWLDVISPRAT